MKDQPGFISPGRSVYPFMLPVLAVLLLICIHAEAGNDRNSGVPGGDEYVIHTPQREIATFSPGLPEDGENSFLHNAGTFPYPARQTLSLRQRRNLRREHYAGLGVNLLGPTLGYGSVCMNYSIGNTSQLEAGIDLSTVYAGFNLFPVRVSRAERLSPYMGLMAAYGRKTGTDRKDDIYMYMPVGIRYLNDDNWFFSFEVAATTADHVSSSPFYAGIKLGYLFRQ